MSILVLGNKVMHEQCVECIAFFGVIELAHPGFPLCLIHVWEIGKVEEGCMSQDLLAGIAQCDSKDSFFTGNMETIDSECCMNGQDIDQY